MKRSILCAFALAMALSGIANGAIPTKSDIRSATSLANENVMTSNIDQARGNRPLGSIVAYPYKDSLSLYVSDDWVECDGRPIPANTDAYKKMGLTRTPNLYIGLGANGKGYATRAGSAPRQTSADKFRSHAHGQPAHVHKVTGGLTSTDVSLNLDSDKIEGIADPQEVTYNYTWFHWGPSSIPIGGYNEHGNWVPVGENTHTEWQSDHSHSYTYWGRCYGGTDENGHAWYYDCLKSATTGSAGGHQHDIVYGGGGIIGPRDTLAESKESEVTAEVKDKHSTGNVVNGDIGGTALSSGGDNTYKTGDDETAPTYYTVRYFMRVNE